MMMVIFQYLILPDKFHTLGGHYKFILMAPSRILEQRGTTTLLRLASRRSRLSCRNKIRKVHWSNCPPSNKTKFLSRGRIIGIGSVNDVPRARFEHAARMEEEYSLRRDLTAAKEVIADHRDKFAFMANMFDLMIETISNINPTLAFRWQSLRPSFVPEPTPAEHADLERFADEHSSDLFDEINLNT
ncbi:hypothetical protein Bca101_039212 [Brassica carinata]